MARIQTKVIGGSRCSGRKGNRLGPKELGFLAKRFAAASNPVEAARIKELITLGFYGI